jgi:hypothetical protein
LTTTALAVMADGHGLRVATSRLADDVRLEVVMEAMDMVATRLGGEPAVWRRSRRWQALAVPADGHSAPRTGPPPKRSKDYLAGASKPSVSPKPSGRGTDQRALS